MDGLCYFQPFAQIEIQEQMASPFEILMLCLLGVIAFRVLFLRRNHQVSLLVPVLAGLLIVGVLLMGYATVGSGSRRRDRDMARNARQTHVVEIPGSTELLAETGSSIPDEALTTTESTSVRIEETEHGNMLVMPLSTAILEQHLGPDGVRALESMTSALPDELNQAYFMVPLPGAVGDAVPGLRALASAITQVAQNSPVALTAESATDVAAEADGPVVSEPAAQNIVVRPEWIENPSDGQLVVTTEFEETRELVDLDLHKKVTETLLAEAWQSVAPEGTRQVRDGRRLQLTEDAVNSCIRERFQDELVLELASGPATMYATSALLEYPEELQTQAEVHVEASLRNQRTWTVGAAAVSLGLVVMLAAGLLQAGRSSRRLTRYLGVPLIGLVMLPGIAISGRLVQRVVARQSADVPSPFVLHDTVLDVQPNPELTSSSDLQASEEQYLD